MVAGNLQVLEDEFVTKSGRKVALKIFVEPQNTDKTAYAMAALKRAMKWDEDSYGREYDLDIFMIVAVDDFNMGQWKIKASIFLIPLVFWPIPNRHRYGLSAY